jgi:cytochrome c oxidase subunit 2
MPLDASAQASIVDGLFNWHILLIAFLFSLVVVFMLYALVVFRRREGDEGDGEHFEGNTRLEIFWTATPMIFVVIFAYLGVVTLGDVTRPHEDEMTIGVNGFQWGWSFEYEGDVVSPEMVVPLNRPLRLEMTSQDVLHSFWVPEFRVKQDLVPGQVTELRITPTEEGEFRLRCAELCGLSHYSMLATVRVVPEEEFAMWLDEQLAEQAPAVAQQPAAASNAD